MTRKTHAKVIRENDQAITPAQAKRAANLFASYLNRIRSEVLVLGTSVVVPGIGVFYPKKFKPRMWSFDGEMYGEAEVTHLAFRPFKDSKARAQPKPYAQPMLKDTKP